MNDFILKYIISDYINLVTSLSYIVFIFNTGADLGNCGWGSSLCKQGQSP